MSDLVEQTRQYLNETPGGLETEFLNEMISLRTGAIVMGLAKTKGYANKVDQINQRFTLMLLWKW